jgi:hypothetical protein
VISLQVGDCLLWSLIIFLIHRFVSTVFGPHSLTGRCGGDFPHTTVANKVLGVATTIFVAPPGEGFVGNTPGAKY